MYKYIIVVAIIFVGIYFLFAKTKTETFTNFESIEEKDILPIYKNVTPQEMIDFFGGIDQFAAVLVENNIPVKYLTDPAQYPKIASYLELKFQ